MTIVNELGLGLNEAFNDRRRGLLRNLRREDRLKLNSFARRAVITALIGWLVAIFYLIVTPVKYVSRWTLNLPGASQSATMSIESVGQATTTAASPFGTVSLSPKVVYREIADSDAVRSDAASRIGLTYQDFGRPRIKLIDETALMLFEIGAPTPELAQKKALASILALNAQLETLRKDELEKRSTAVTQNLKGYQQQVETARARIAQVQLETGLVSINQFNELVASLGSARRRMIDLSGEVDKARQEQQRLIERIGVEPGEASLALRLAGDPMLSKVATEFADANGAYIAQSGQLGPGNPVMINLNKKRVAAHDSLDRLMAARDPKGTSHSRATSLLTNLSHQSDLLQQLVRNEATYEGKRRELETITAERDRLEHQVNTLSGAAARLEDLKKDHLLAEAVYSSALARVDTSKSDIYGAYPIVQVLAQPNFPEGHEQPRRLYAFAGGVAATLFSLFTWALAWLHYLQTTRRRKKPSSTG